MTWFMGKCLPQNRPLEPWCVCVLLRGIPLSKPRVEDPMFSASCAHAQGTKDTGRIFISDEEGYRCFGCTCQISTWTCGPRLGHIQRLMWSLENANVLKTT
eukprot:6241911-Amphidinium_carterae.2